MSSDWTSHAATHPSPLAVTLDVDVDVDAPACCLCSLSLPLRCRRPPAWPSHRAASDGLVPPSAFHPSKGFRYGGTGSDA